MTIKVGITGGIGSGKSIVCKIFASIGIPIFYADDAAKHLMVTNKKLVSQIKVVLGEESYLPGGELNKQHVGQQIFNNKDQMKALNALVHPAVHQYFQEWAQHQTSPYPYVLDEAALLFESGGNAFLDYNITVFAPKEIRIQRVIKRDKTTYQAVESRINNQWSDDEKMVKSDFVIINDGKSLLIPQVMKIHQTLKNRAQK